MNEHCAETLRITYVTLLIISGTPLPMAQKLARHSTPVLTSNVYTNANVADLAKYVEGLAGIDGPPTAPPHRAVVHTKGVQ